MKKLMSIVLSSLAALTLCSTAFAANKTTSGFTLGMSGNEITHVTGANMLKYGGDDELSIPIKLPESYGSLRLVDEDVIEGDDVIGRISLKDNKLVLRAKFPSDMEEPEDYEVEATVRGSKNKEEVTFRVSGSVYYQDADGPVAPDKYREKKFVIVDFDENDEDNIRFKGGRLYTENLDSGIANLDISYAETMTEKLENKDIAFVNFPAAPRLDRNITVGLDADEGDCVYEISGKNVKKIDAKYKDGELTFSTRRLGQYVLTDGELSAAKDDTSSSNKPWTAGKDKTDTSSQQAGKPTVMDPSSTNIIANGNKPNPGTGAYPVE